MTLNGCCGSEGGYGLTLEADATYRENTITGNVTGAVNGSGVNMGGNYCAATGVTSAGTGPLGSTCQNA